MTTDNDIRMKGLRFNCMKKVKRGLAYRRESF